MVACAAGCGTRGFSIEDAVPDRSVITGSTSRTEAVHAAIPYAAATPQDATPRTVAAGSVTDEATIRNAVTSALIEEAAEAKIGWSNAATGSRGTIGDLRETRDGPTLCRTFTATNESIHGVHLYRGEACMGASRQWRMHRFARVE